MVSLEGSVQGTCGLATPTQVTLDRRVSPGIVHTSTSTALGLAAKAAAKQCRDCCLAARLAANLSSWKFFGVWCGARELRFVHRCHVAPFALAATRSCTVTVFKSDRDLNQAGRNHWRGHNVLL